MKEEEKMKKNQNALFAGEENNIELWRLAQESEESSLCLPAQVFTHTFSCSGFYSHL